MDLKRTRERDIKKLTSYIYNTIQTKLELPGVEIFYGSVSVRAELDEGAFLPHEVHIAINGEKWHFICGKDPKLLSEHAAKEIWGEMHKRATEELIIKCGYLAKAKKSDVMRIADYINLGCKSNEQLPLLRITYGNVLMVSRFIDSPQFNNKIQLLLNGKYDYTVGGKNILESIPSIAEKVWSKMRTMAENELENQGGHRINSAKFNRRFVQSYPPSGKF